LNPLDSFMGVLTGRKKPAPAPTPAATPDTGGSESQAALNAILQIAEPSLTLATGIGGSSVGGLAGLVDLGVRQDGGQAAKTVQDTQQAMTYLPRTQPGQKTLGALLGTAKDVGKTFTEYAPWMSPQHNADYAFEKTGSPGLATLLATVAPQDILPAGKLSGLAAGTLYGLKRMPALYHGTNRPESMTDVLLNGFQEGRSAELRLPGASFSQDPSVSMGFAGGDPGLMLRVTPDVSPAEVRNLRPSEYLVGVQGHSIYNKPNAAMFDEAETFMPRNAPRHSPEEYAAQRDTLARIKKHDDELVLEQNRLHDEQMGLVDTDPRYHEVSKRYDKLESDRDMLRSIFVEESRRLSTEPAPPPATARPLTADEVSHVEAAYSSVDDALRTIPTGGRHDWARVIRATRGNRGGFDKVMREITQYHNGPEARPAVAALSRFHNMQSYVRKTRQVPAKDAKAASALLAPAKRPEDTSYNTRNMLDDTRRKAGLPAIKGDASIADLRETLDAAQRLWVKERNKLADTIDKQGIVRARDIKPPAPLSRLENRTQEIDAERWLCDYMNK